METGDPSRVAVAGRILDERYRLERVVADGQTADGRASQVWLATDLSLERPVTLVVCETRTAAERQELLEAAARAGQVADARWARVLDVGTAGPLRTSAGRWSWLACEWIEGPTLSARLQQGRMSLADALALGRHLAEAVVAAERAGCRHGRLRPDRVVLPDGGVPRIAGLEIAAALPAGRSERRPGSDVRGAGALLFAALTGRWPDGPAAGLAGAERGDAAHAAGSLHPRQLRREIPRELDDVVVRALRDDYPDGAALARALRAISLPEPARGPGRDPRWALVRRWAWRVVPPLVVVALGVTGWTIGSDLGRVPLAARRHHPTLPAAQASAPGTGALRLVWNAPPLISSFDPHGDGEENPSAVGLAVDRDPSTSWTTVTYRGSPHFGGLKPGVGLLLDLRRPTTVRVAELSLTAPGAAVELRAGDTAPHSETDLRLLTAAPDAGAQVRWTLPQATTARYWLVWFTALPPAPGGYRIGVTEVALLGAAS